jgi:hypothetical protein
MADQGKTDTGVALTQEIDGVEMGILEDGTPFLTGRSLARLCGVVPSAVIKQADNWLSGNRSGRLGKMLVDGGHDADSLYIKTSYKGREVHAYPDSVCMVFLEYYAFEVDGQASDVARKNYRTLARSTLRVFIYKALNYNPTRAVSDSWQQFHDRLLLNNAPTGFFSVFKEIADVILSAIKGGLRVDHETVPDISVGSAWARHWKVEKLAETFGERKQHPHLYPDYFPQSAMNPIDTNVYPNAALGAFRIWLQEVYLVLSFPRYLRGKVASGAIEADRAKLFLLEIGADDDDPDGSN